MSTISDRIKEIRQHFFDGSNVNFALRLNENTNTTSGWVSGKRGIGNAVIKKIIDSFPEINAEWLLTGEGEMLKNGNVSISQSGNTIAGNRDVNIGDRVNEGQANYGNADLQKENELFKQKITFLEKQVKDRDEQIEFLKELLNPKKAE